MDYKSLIRPVASCLVVGALVCLTDWQSAHQWVPAIVDGAKVALLMGAGMLGVEGTASSINKIRTDSPGNTPAK